MTATEPAPRPDAPIAVSLETGASEGRLGLVPVTQDANRLDLWGRLAVGGLVAVWLILIRFSLSMIVIYPMNFIPLLALILRAKRNGDIIDRSAIIRRFCLGFFLGPTILFTALLCAQAISTVVPQDHVDAAACVVLGVLVVVEEAVKFASRIQTDLARVQLLYSIPLPHSDSVDLPAMRHDGHGDGDARGSGRLVHVGIGCVWVRHNHMYCAAR